MPTEVAVIPKEEPQKKEKTKLEKVKALSISFERNEKSTVMRAWLNQRLFKEFTGLEYGGSAYVEHIRNVESSGSSSGRRTIQAFRLSGDICVNDETGIAPILFTYSQERDRYFSGKGLYAGSDPIFPRDGSKPSIAVFTAAGISTNDGLALRITGRSPTVSECKNYVRLVSRSFLLFWSESCSSFRISSTSTVIDELGDSLVDLHEIPENVD